MPQGPLSGEHIQEMELGRARFRKVRRAASVASMSAWTVGLMAIASLVLGVWEPEAGVVGLGLAAAAFNEFRGAGRLRRAELSGPVLLAWNQVFLFAVVLGYCIYKIVTHVRSADEAQLQELLTDPGVVQMLGEWGFVAKHQADWHYYIYGGMAAGAMLMQAGTAWYYLSRRKHIMAYLSKTPAWVVDMQRRGA